MDQSVQPKPVITFYYPLDPHEKYDALISTSEFDENTEELIVVAVEIGKEIADQVIDGGLSIGIDTGTSYPV